MEYPNPVCQAQFIQKSSSQRHLPAKAPGNPDTLELKFCKPRFFQAAACCAIGCTSRRRPVSTSKTRPRTGTSFARGILRRGRRGSTLLVRVEDVKLHWTS